MVTEEGKLVGTHGQRRVCNLLVGADEVGKSYGIWLAVVVGHRIEYGACSGVLAGVCTCRNDGVQNTDLTTYPNVRDLQSRKKPHVRELESCVPFQAATPPASEQPTCRHTDQ